MGLGLKLLKTHEDEAHGSTVVFSVGGDDDVDGLNDTLEGLVQPLGLQLQLQQSAVHLVHHQHWLDALSNGLTQHRLSLHTDTCKEKLEVTVES